MICFDGAKIQKSTHTPVSSFVMIHPFKTPIDGDWTARAKAGILQSNLN
jgi:hypothetical protein